MEAGTVAGRDVSPLISGDKDNGLISSAQDQKLYFNAGGGAVLSDATAGRALDVGSLDPADLISADPSNVLRLGSDGKLIVLNASSWRLDYYGRDFDLTTTDMTASPSWRGDILDIDFNCPDTGSFIITFRENSSAPKMPHPSRRAPGSAAGLRMKWDMTYTPAPGAGFEIVEVYWGWDHNYYQGGIQYVATKGEFGGETTIIPQNQETFLSYSNIGINGGNAGPSFGYENLLGNFAIMGQFHGYDTAPVAGKISINIANCTFRYANS